MQKNINLAANQLLQQNFAHKKALQKSADHLNFVNSILKNKIFKSPKGENCYTGRAVLNILNYHLDVFQAKQQKILQRQSAVQKKIISVPRALKMAENIFTGGKWKIYRDNLRIFNHQIKPNFNDYIFDLNARQKMLDEQKNYLQKICSTPQARQKIAQIAAGIVRKNQKFVTEFNNLQQQNKTLSEKISALKLNIITLQAKFSRTNPKNLYKISPPKDTPHLSLAQTIANICLFDKLPIIENIFSAKSQSKDVAINARITDKGFDLEEDNWNLLSELKKDEKKHKEWGRLI